MAPKLRVFIILIILWTFVSIFSVNCEVICLDQEANTKPRYTEDCQIPATPLTKDEFFRVKNLLVETVCKYYHYALKFIIFQKGNGLNFYTFDNVFKNSRICSNFFDGTSGLLYWIPINKTKPIVDDVHNKESYAYYIENDNSKHETLQLISISDIRYDFKYLNNIEKYLLMMIKPTYYAIEDVKLESETKTPVEIVDLGTFSFYNPSDEPQKINFKINVTNHLFMESDHFLFSNTQTDIIENGNVWQGESGMFLQRKGLENLALDFPIPPKTSVTGRIFSTVTITNTPFTATMKMKDPKVTENFAKTISGKIKKYENTNLRLENVRMSSREHRILIASYLACFVGLITTLIIGIAVFLTCLVAQKKNKECICPRPQFNINWTKKKQFVADKARNIGKVFEQVGDICGNICNCIYKEVV